MQLTPGLPFLSLRAGFREAADLFKPTLLYSGYVRITDLGIARIWKPDNENETSGTPGYMGNQFSLGAK